MFGYQWLCGMLFFSSTRMVVRRDFFVGGMCFVWRDVLFGGEFCWAVSCVVVCVLLFGGMF